MIEESLILEFYKSLKNTLNKKILERELKIKEVENKIITIIGPRRAGKTYFLFQLLRELKDNNFIYLDFENLALRDLNIKEIYQVISQIYIQIEGKEPKYIFLDEIQNIKNWESLVRTLLDKKKYFIFVTGSSSKLLSKEIATQLRGRSLSYLLLPFSFREFLRAKGLEFEKYLSFKEKGLLLNHLEAYLKFGGFPEVVLEKNLVKKEKILKEYLDLVLFKDVIDRFNIKQIKLMKVLFKFVLNSYSSELTIKSLINKIRTTGVNPSNTTVYKYISYLEDSFYFFFVSKFDYKIHLRESWPKKVYLVDTGLSLPFRFSQDKGKLMENVVFLELKRRENVNPFQEIYYYKTKNGKEIDFLVKDRDKLELIEVCYEFDEEHKKKLIKAMKELGLKESLCITWDEEEVIEEKGFRIKLVPLWKWLLGVE